MATSVHVFDNFIQDSLRGTINVATHVFKAVLVNGYTFDQTHALLSQITNKLPDGNGYTPKTLTNITLSFLDDKTKWTADDIIWQATGGTFGPFDGLVIYSDTSTNDRLVLYVNFGDTHTLSEGVNIIVPFGLDGIISIE